MWGWFGGSSASQNRKDSPKNAILGLRSQLDMLQKRHTHLENQIAEQDATARKYVAANNTTGKQDDTDIRHVPRARIGNIIPMGRGSCETSRDSMRG